MRGLVIAALLTGTCQAQNGATKPTLIQTGEWEVMTEDLRQAIPYAEGPFVYELRRQAKGPSGGFRGCLSKDQAIRPPAEFLSGNFHARGCPYQSFHAKGGMIRAAAQCLQDGDRFEIEGRFNRQSFVVVTRASYRGETLAYPLDTETRTIGRRTGKCRD